MFNLVTGKKKEFSTIIARSGAGKTALAYLLIKRYFMPTLIIDTYNQFKGSKITFNRFLELSTDINFLNDFYALKRQIVINAKEGEIEFIFNTLMTSKRFKGILIFIDEIDMTLGNDRIKNKDSFYHFLNRGRHKEFFLITTARNTASIPKQLIGQTDFFYFSDLIEKGAIDFVNDTLKGLRVADAIRDLKKYQFLRVDVNNKIVQRFHTRAEWLDYFSQK
jgi:hypothetical protein